MQAAVVVAPAVVKIHAVQPGYIGGGCSGQLPSLQSWANLYTGYRDSLSISNNAVLEWQLIQTD